MPALTTINTLSLAAHLASDDAERRACALNYLDKAGDGASGMLLRAWRIERFKITLFGILLFVFVLVIGATVQEVVRTYLGNPASRLPIWIRILLTLSWQASIIFTVVQIERRCPAPWKDSARSEAIVLELARRNDLRAIELIATLWYDETPLNRQREQTKRELARLLLLLGKQDAAGQESWGTYLLQHNVRPLYKGGKRCITTPVRDFSDADVYLLSTLMRVSTQTQDRKACTFMERIASGNATTVNQQLVRDAAQTALQSKSVQAENKTSTRSQPTRLRYAASDRPVQTIRAGQGKQ